VYRKEEKKLYKSEGEMENEEEEMAC